MEAINPKPMHTTTAGDSPLHTTTSSSLDIALRDPSLLRGCTAGTLLNDCSSVFSSNILGKDEVSIMHKNTAQVDKLDDFVSHSWRTDRWTKWGALMLHFNGDAALAAMLTVNLSIHALEAFSIIPTIFPVRVHAINMDGSTWIYNQSGMPQICGWLATFIFFLNWQEIRTWLPSRFVAPRYAFLDKICIDQEDDARKSAGIASLGAFLAHSSPLLTGVLHKTVVLLRARRISQSAVSRAAHEVYARRFPTTAIYSLFHAALELCIHVLHRHRSRSRS